jgi:regulator of protease activity HflC (stomatin/prohibitin superfamily)
MNISALTQGLVALAWVAAVIAGVVIILRASRNQPTKGGGRVVLILVLVALLLTSTSGGLVFVSPQDRAVVLSAVSAKGYREQALTPGLHWIIPFAETIVSYPISRQTYTMSSTPSEGSVKGDDSVVARTSDGQQISIDASVIYQADPNKVVLLHIQWQNRYTDELVRPQARGIVRDTVAQYTVDEVLTSKRLEMIQTINDRMTQKLADNGLILVDFVLRNITFSSEYAASIEQKQIAEQQALQAKLVVESKRQEAEQARQTAQGAADAAVIRAKGDADARLISAEAEAKSLALIASAIKDNPGLLNYQYITKLSPNLQVMLVPNNSPFLLPFPTTQASSTDSTPAVQPTPAPTAAPTVAPTPEPTKAP